MQIIIRITALLYLFAAMSSAWAEPPPLTKVSALHIGMHRIQAEIADTPQSRERGLMRRTHLCEHCGMLFVFEEAAKHGFWMKNTPLPLSIAFINDQGIIINIAEMQANTTIIHRAQEDALYALEMNQGWFALRGIKRGDAIQGYKTVHK
ncbi:MAG: DUF192 domain-containing protein [Candidatus Nitrotoga sp.]